MGRLPGQEGQAYFNTGKDGNYFGGALMVQTANDIIKEVNPSAKVVSEPLKAAAPGPHRRVGNPRF